MPDKQTRPPINQSTASMMRYESPFVTARVGLSRWRSRARYDETMLVSIDSDHSDAPEFRRVGANRKPYPYRFEIMTNGGEVLDSGVSESINDAICAAARLCKNMAAAQPATERLAKKPLEKYVGKESKSVERIIACCTSLDDLLDLGADTLNSTEFAMLYHVWVLGLTVGVSYVTVGVSKEHAGRSLSQARLKIGEYLQSTLLLHSTLDALSKRKHPSVLRQLNDRNLNRLLRHGITNYLMLLKRTNAAISRETGVNQMVLSRVTREVKEIEGIYDG